MEYFPIFAHLKQRSVLIVGGGDVAARKIQLLIRAGAKIRVVARELCPEVMKMLQVQHVNWVGKTFNPNMLNDVFLVIAATDDTEMNDQIYKSAEENHTLANVVDDQPRCSFIFPSIIDRTPIIVAISSGGKSPVLARLLREKLESLLPHFLGPMATLAGTWRSSVKQHIKSVVGRRQFWEKALNGRFAHLVAQGRLKKAEKRLEETLKASPTTQPQGVVYLVGAGPGDSGLLTLRGLQVMQQADVVLYDHLVSPEVMELVRRDAERICVGKRGGEEDAIPQENINHILVTLAQQGKKVVRLKGGDPFVFGRGAEELQTVAAAGIPFQVVPGITAAIGATAYAGIPLTHRNYAQSVTLITGHLHDRGDMLDWQALACSNQTLVIYMGMINAANIRIQLIANGRPAETPVAVISRGTYQDQQVLTGTLEELEQLAQQGMSPMLLVIGEVVAIHHEINWFGQDPLLLGGLPFDNGYSLVNLA